MQTLTLPLSVDEVFSIVQRAASSRADFVSVDPFMLGTAIAVLIMDTYPHDARAVGFNQFIFGFDDVMSSL